MKMTVLVSCHLSRDVKKKKKRVFQVFLRLICLEPISFRLRCFEPFIFRPICFKAFSTKVTGYYKPTNQVLVARRQQTKLNQKRGQFPFCRHPIKADSTTWAPIGSAKGHMGSHGS